MNLVIAFFFSLIAILSLSALSSEVLCTDLTLLNLKPPRCSSYEPAYIKQSWNKKRDVHLNETFIGVL